MWQNGKVSHGEDTFRKYLPASDVLLDWPKRAISGNDLWHAHLNVKVIVHEIVLLTSFHFFSISRNLAKLKIYISGQNDLSVKVL